MESRKCAECGTKISGRADKKYCSDECRSAANNKLNASSTNLMRRVNLVLKKNRRILKKLNPSGKTRVDTLRLSQEGFNFHYFTNTYTTKAGKIYFFCYDQGYLKLDNDQFALVEKQDYVT